MPPPAAELAAAAGPPTSCLMLAPRLPRLTHALQRRLAPCASWFALNRPRSFRCWHCEHSAMAIKGAAESARRSRRWRRSGGSRFINALVCQKARSSWKVASEAQAERARPLGGSLQVTRGGGKGCFLRRCTSYAHSATGADTVQAGSRDDWRSPATPQRDRPAGPAADGAQSASSRSPARPTVIGRR